MFGQYLLSFYRLPFHFVDGLFCHTYLLIWCSHTCFLLFFSLLLSLILVSNTKKKKNKQKTVANTDVKELTTYVSSKLYCCGSYIQFYNPFWWVQFHSFACSFPFLIIPFIEEMFLSWVYILGFFAVNWPCIQGFISGLSILLHWSMCLCSVPKHTHTHCFYYYSFAM